MMKFMFDEVYMVKKHAMMQSVLVEDVWNIEDKS